jgi:hypothetical protein
MLTAIIENIVYIFQTSVLYVVYAYIVIGKKTVRKNSENTSVCAN